MPPSNHFRQVQCVPIREDRAVHTRVLVADVAVTALADAAFHPALEVDLDVGSISPDLLCVPSQDKHVDVTLGGCPSTDNGAVENLRPGGNGG